MSQPELSAARLACLDAYSGGVTTPQAGSYAGASSRLRELGDHALAAVDQAEPAKQVKHAQDQLPQEQRA